MVLVGNTQKVTLWFKVILDVAALYCLSAFYLRTYVY